jgi:hypothetical protein
MSLRQGQLLQLLLVHPCRPPVWPPPPRRHHRRSRRPAIDATLAEPGGPSVVVVVEQFIAERTEIVDAAAAATGPGSAVEEGTHEAGTTAAKDAVVC